MRRHFQLAEAQDPQKAGITVSLKNLVGINGDKNWLPHHTEGNPNNGGDEHPNPGSKHKFERLIVPYFRFLSLRVPGLGPWPIDGHDVRDGISSEMRRK